MPSARNVAALTLCALAALAACERGSSTGGGAPDPAPPGPPATLASALTSGEQAALGRLPVGDAHDIVAGNCVTCHDASMILQQHKDTTGWRKTVTQMVAFGTPLDSAQQTAVVQYLAKHFPGRPSAPSPPSRP